METADKGGRIVTDFEKDAFDKLVSQGSIQLDETDSIQIKNIQSGPVFIQYFINDEYVKLCAHKFTKNLKIRATKNL